METVISMQGICKDYIMGDVTVKALRHVDLNVEKGEMLAIMGASGSGKSTLMNIIGCLDVASSGKYILNNKDVASLTKDQYADIRNSDIGFVFQGFNLLARTTALENVEMPLYYNRTKKIKDTNLQAKEKLELVGLGDRMDHEPNQLSGGQQQRVAIARALVNNPAILLADEPTGNLDSRTSLEVMKLFQELNQLGITIILVTHEQDVASFAKRIVYLRDGLVLKDYKLEKQDSAEEALANWHEDDHDFEEGLPI